MTDNERQVQATEVVKRASKKQLREMRKTALRLGKETSFSAKEAARGLEELASAGVSISDAIARLRLSEADIEHIVGVIDDAARATPADPKEMADG